MSTGRFIFSRSYDLEDQCNCCHNADINVDNHPTRLERPRSVPKRLKES